MVSQASVQQAHALFKARHNPAKKAEILKHLHCFLFSGSLYELMRVQNSAYGKTTEQEFRQQLLQKFTTP